MDAEDLDQSVDLSRGGVRNAVVPWIQRRTFRRMKPVLTRICVRSVRGACFLCARARKLALGSAGSSTSDYWSLVGAARSSGAVVVGKSSASTPDATKD